MASEGGGVLIMGDGGWERGEAAGRRGRSSVECGEGVGSSGVEWVA